MTNDPSNRLEREIAELPREIEPQRDLWPTLSTRLEPRRSRLLRFFGLAGGWTGPATLRLAGAAALLVLVAVTLWLVRRPEVAPQITPAVAAGAPAAYQASAELARSEDGVLQARHDLLEAVQRQREHLAPETVEILEENMRIIDQAIGEIRSALDDDPQNQQLNMLLAAQYQREVELLKQVSGV